MSPAAKSRQIAGLRPGGPDRAELACIASRRAAARLWHRKMRPHFDALYGPELRDGRGSYHEGMATRAAGLERARRYRGEQPFKALLDELYGAEA